MLSFDKQKEDTPKKAGKRTPTKERLQPEKTKAAAGKNSVTISSPRIFLTEDSFYRSRMPRNPHWSVVWSDLMMTMFIFFVVLYVYATAQKEFLGQEGLGNYLGPSSLDTRVIETTGSGLGEAGAPSEGFIEKMFDLSKQALSDEALHEFASVELVPEQTVRIILTGDLLFASGRAEVRTEAKKSLAAIAQLLVKTPYAINVIGHTDDRPIATHIYPSNWELSTARASAVARYLINEMNIPASQFYITGHAAFRPVRSNDSPRNQAKNRRVEIVITKEKPGAMSTPTSHNLKQRGSSRP
jgi:chemotaxis protein MotB